jgi:hypothetical protein
MCVGGNGEQRFIDLAAIHVRQRVLDRPRFRNTRQFTARFEHCVDVGRVEVMVNVDTLGHDAECISDLTPAGLPRPF